MCGRKTRGNRSRACGSWHWTRRCALATLIIKRHIDLSSHPMALPLQDPVPISCRIYLSPTMPLGCHHSRCKKELGGLKTRGGNLRKRCSLCCCGGTQMDGSLVDTEGHVQALFCNTGTRKCICWMPDPVAVSWGLDSLQVFGILEIRLQHIPTAGSNRNTGILWCSLEEDLRIRLNSQLEFCRIHPPSPAPPPSPLHQFLINWNYVAFHFSHCKDLYNAMFQKLHSIINRVYALIGHNTNKANKWVSYLILLLHA